MSTVGRALRVNALELLRQPGATKTIEVDASGEELDVEHESLNGDVRVAVELEALTDGISVRGEVVAPWAAPCRRCLRDLSDRSVAVVEELYQVEVLDDDAYPIVDNRVDLAPMARQLALLELDEERLCRQDCAGLCGVCGIDLNASSCECDTTVKDDRWSALDGLVLDD